MWVNLTPAQSTEIGDDGGNTHPLSIKTAMSLLCANLSQQQQQQQQQQRQLQLSDWHRLHFPVSIDSVVKESQLPLTTVGVDYASRRYLQFQKIWLHKNSHLTFN
ncbi:hypothetical protein AWZ03_010929 [Drosophila navojoa]|uniref:Uncharacterized protein n=1 Tax=Drosophila navojoa TaxID=7232 RepID=A0A484B302_DRONA|nr:hypothetical protein AWZ03_010929 [Drosophila navojoa]